MRSGITRKTNESLKSYLILLISVTLATYFIYLFLIPALTPPQEPPPFNDIIYHEKGYEYSDLKFIDQYTDNPSAVDVVIRIPRDISVLGVDIPLLDRRIENQISTVTWSPDGQKLAFTYGIDEIFIRYPGVLSQTGELSACPQNKAFSTYFSYPIKFLPDETLIMNIGEKPHNYLAEINIQECKQEAIYFDGQSEGYFDISSKGWLAVFENIDGAFFVNVYDDQQQKVLAIPVEDYVDWIEWSKDGSQLLYKDFWDHSYFMMMNYNFQTGETTLIGKNVYSATFSPDGEKIALTEEDGIYIWNQITTQLYFLVNGSAPQWRPISD